MKKVKIMLMSIAILAVVGGSLAFKANFNRQICTMDPALYDPTTVTQSLACPLISNFKTTINDGVQAWIVIPADEPVETFTTEVNGPVFCDPTQCDLLKEVKSDL